MPHAVSNLPKYSNVLNFDTCQYQYEVPVIDFIQAHDSDDEIDYYDVRNCRMQVETYYKEMAVVNRINENKKALEVVAAVDVKIENREVMSPHIIRVDSVDKLAQNVLAAKIISNIPSADLSTTVKKVESKSSDLLKGLISLKVSEEALCLSMNGKIEKYEIQGTVGVTYKIQDNDNNDGDHKNNSHIASDLTDKYNDKLVNSTASMKILFEDAGGVLNNIKANSSFISSPVLPDVSKQKLKIENIPKNSPDKISPIMKYSMLPTFQPFYFKARSKMRIQVPNAKILVQIILNPVYKSFFKSMDSFIIQASLSCFLFDKDSKVNIRPIDKFNENTKIVTWVCSGIDVEKETSLELECSLEGTNDDFFYPLNHSSSFHTLSV